MSTALNRLAASVVTRGKGQNVIARAAYNARERLVDGRTNTVYDYRYLGEPEWKGIFTPEHAEGWASDRQELWNTVERREDHSTRPDQAQLARDFKIALPYELNIDQRRDLTREFAAQMAKEGMVVDVAIHIPGRDDDPRNYHVHMLLTMREVMPDGFGNKVRAWNRDTELERWKERWSELGAQHLERAGLHREGERFRVGHLTLEKQRDAALERGDVEWAASLDRERTKHMGPQAAALEKQGIQTEIGTYNREIRERNAARAKTRDLSRTDGEIRLACRLTGTGQAFADALEDRGLILARVTTADLGKLAALEARHFTQKEAEYSGNLTYLDRRIAVEKQAGNAGKVAELERSREKVEKQYQATVGWMRLTGGVDGLTPEQRETAQGSYNQWQYRTRHSFEGYVSYVQEKWQNRPPDASRFKVNDLVVVNQFGDVYPITERNTGHAPKILRNHLKEIDRAPLFSVTGAWEVLRELHQHRREEAL